MKPLITRSLPPALPTIKEHEPMALPVRPGERHWFSVIKTHEMHRVPSFRAIEVTKMIDAAETLMVMRMKGKW